MTKLPFTCYYRKKDIMMYVSVTKRSDKERFYAICGRMWIVDFEGTCLIMEQPKIFLPFFLWTCTYLNIAFNFLLLNELLHE